MQKTIIKAMRRRVHWILFCAYGYFVGLALQFALTPPECYGPLALYTYMVTPILMLMFGPYLLVQRGAWIGSGEYWWLLQIVPIYLAHLYFVWKMLARQRFVGRWGFDRVLLIVEMTVFACLSALGIWFALPVVGHHEVHSDKIVGNPVRVAVVSDLHSCCYGPGQRGIVEMIDSQNPDLVLMVGDIFDDRHPDIQAHVLVENLVKRYECVYVTGNHEFWSDRVVGMKSCLRRAGVTVLEQDCRTYSIKGSVIDICGVDDPTEMMDEYWFGLLRDVNTQCDPRHIRILLSHRPEYAVEYAKLEFDLILTGHAHGGQWRCPFADLGVFSPDQYFFPEYSSGVYPIGKGSRMVVSRGLARESSPVPRYFNHPEIVMVDIMK